MARTPADMKNEIATLATDPFRWWYGGRVQNEDQVLASRGQGKGLWLYDELARDPKVGNALDKRRLALFGRTWELEPADDSASAAAPLDLVQAVFDGIPFDALIGDLLHATLKGIAIAEVIWAATDLGVVPARIVARDPRRFTFRDVPGQPPELRLLTREAPIDGIALPARKFIVHRFGGLYGSPWGLGLGQRLFWPVFFKRQGIGFWLSAVEKFAAPTPLGKYPPGTSDADQKKLLEALAAIAREAAVVVPEGMIVELVEAKRSGAFDTYEKLARYMDEDIAITVLGETLTTSAGDAGSRALGQVHNDVRLELVKSDADNLSGTLNDQLIRWICEVNLPGAKLPRIWWNFDEPEDLNALAQRVKMLDEAGWVFSPERMADDFGEGISRKPKPEPPPQLAPSPAQRGRGGEGAVPPGATESRDALAELFAERGRRAPRPRDAADDLAEQLNSVAMAEADAAIEAIRALVDRAESLEALADQLLALFPGLPSARLGELLGQAMAVSHLAGRDDLTARG